MAKKSQSGEEGNETAAFEEPPPDKGKEETELDSIPIYWRLHGRSVGRDTNDYYVAGGNFLPIGGGGGGIVYLYCDLAGRSPRRYGTESAPLVRFLLGSENTEVFPTELLFKYLVEIGLC